MASNTIDRHQQFNKENQYSFHSIGSFIFSFDRAELEGVSVCYLQGPRFSDFHYHGFWLGIQCLRSCH